MSDVLASVDTDTSYTTLKAALIQRYTSQSSGCLQSILNECCRGNKSVSEYLIELRSRLGEHYDTRSLLHMDLLKHKLMESLDPQSRLCLYHYENEPIESFARHADQILARASSLPSSPAASNVIASNQQLINESVDAKLSQIQQNLVQLNKTSDNSQARSYATGTPRRLFQGDTPHQVQPQRRAIQSPQKTQLEPCRYHSRFGERAFRCEGPLCPMHHLVVPRQQQFSVFPQQQAKNVTPVSTV